ncbi:MAG: peptidoglycan DD-metalloendopeptidase family protein [Patescibacteria group bacterium]|nr:peptidoglycan DD-metalloendopeptidase family protein [Patescibacteria group bacterium]
MNISFSWKKFTIRLLLLIIKGLGQLKKVLILFFITLVYKPFYYLFKFFYNYGGRFLILKLYKIYRPIKAIFQKNIFSAKNKFLRIFGGRYIVHIVIIIIALLVSASNINAQGKHSITTRFENKSLIGKLVKTGEFEDGGELIEENIDIENISKKKQKSFYTDEAKYSLAYQPQLDIPEPDEDSGIILTQEGSVVSGIAVADSDEISKYRTEIEYYIVQEGDSTYSIAKKYNITVNTIIWENGLNRYGFIKPGQKLAILPTIGITYKVKKYDNIGKIAKKYNVSEKDIIKASEISDVSSLQIGQKLIIPGARKVAIVSPKKSSRSATYAPAPKTALAKTNIKSSTKLLWPASCRRISQYYHWRHHAVDIACKSGTAIYAAEDGIVQSSGWATGYGKRIIISHGNGMTTLYAHFSKLYVRAGQAVNRGDVIGAMGSTGWSTGSHLHFEVKIRGSKKNPLSYIR